MRFADSYRSMSEPGPSTDSIAAIVLAAGAGTRLRPLTLLRPKALCPVANVLLVDNAIERAGAVTPRIAVNVHHGREQMVEHLSGRVHLSIEDPEPLGTAGAIGGLLPWVQGRDVLTVNADSWHREPLERFVSGWDRERVRLLVVPDGIRPDFPGGLRYAGASLVPGWIARGLKARPSGLYEELLQPAFQTGSLDLVPSLTPFFDCGTPADYLAANLHASGGISVVGPGAVVEGTLVESVVWPGAVVAAGERLVRSIRAGRDITVAVNGPLPAPAPPPAI